MSGLATHMRVSAALQFCNARGEGAYVLHKGDRTAGALIVRHCHRDGTATVYARRYTMEGEAVWDAVTDAPIPDSKADEYVASRVRSDPDLWAIELETSDLDSVLSVL